MTRKIRISLLTAMLGLALLTQSAPSAFACPGKTFGGTGSSCPDGTLQWRYDREKGILVHDGWQKSTTSAGVVYRLILTNRCEAYSNCQAAHTCDNGGTRFNVNAFAVLPDGRLESVVHHRDTVCVYPDRTVPVSHVTAAAHEELRKRIAAPTITSAPRGEKTLINIITIYCTQPQPEPRLDITLPAPGTITATPDYRWDFGDGQGGTGIGLAYNPPDDPAKLPGKYLGPTWTTPGLKHVTLTVTWQVTFQLDGETSIPLDPIVFTATEDKQAVTARAVLVTR